MNVNMFRLVFSKRLGMLVPVGEYAPVRHKGTAAGGSAAAGSRRAVFLLNALAFTLAATFSSASLALPTDPAVVNGAATFNQAGNVLTVTNSAGAIIDWQRFNIGVGETTRFIQPSAASSVLNRVVGNDPSAIYGTLSSNGTVWLVNTAGILVGPGAVIDTAGFVASTLAVRAEDFLAGRLAFQATADAGDVTNQGTITTPTGGSVYLVGTHVANEGTIATPGGETILAAGASVNLIDTGTPGVKVEITGTEGNATNLGHIVAEAGRIGIAGVIVKNSGTLDASSVVSEGGRIFLRASQDAYVDGHGRIVATGTQGGRIEVLGSRVAVMDHASIDASGTYGGGTIKVGGDYQGANPDVQNAQITWFGPEAELKASATNVGAGGTVIVWADDTTRAYGRIEARGGINGGDGGFVETSGKRYLDVAGIEVDASATIGQSGMWLLDPNNVTIVHGTNTLDSNITAVYGGDPFEPSLDTANSILSDGTLNTAIAAGTSVSVSTASTGTAGNGDIILDGVAYGPVVLSKNTADTFSTTLTLNAHRNIVFKGQTHVQTTGSSGTGDLNLVLNPNTGGGGGSVFSEAGSTLYVSGALSGATASVTVDSGDTWYNHGLAFLMDYAFIDLNNGSDATLNNYGQIHIDSPGTGWSFLSTSGAQSAPVNNYGIISVLGTTSWEAKYSQLPGGMLLIADGQTLSMQNMDTVSGNVFIGAGANLAVSEAHAGLRKFNGADIWVDTGGALTPTAGVTFDETEVFAFGNYTIPTSGITYAGIDNGYHASGNLTYSGGITGYAGEIVLASGGDLTINAPLSAGHVALASGMSLAVFNSSYFNDIGFDEAIALVQAGYYQPLAGTRTLINSSVTATNTAALAGYDIELSGSSSSVTSTAGSIKTYAANNMTLDDGAYLSAMQDVSLTFAGAASTLALNSVTYDPYIWAKAPNTIYLNFLGRSAGGVMIEGVETTTNSGDTGFFYTTDKLPATPGSGLMITYSGGITDPCALSPEMCLPPPPPNNDPVTPPVVVGDCATNPASCPPVVDDDTSGGETGEFGGSEEGEAKSKAKKKAGMCRG